MWCKYKGYLAVLGGMVIYLTVGTLYCWGNINPYVTSYIRAHSQPSTLRYADTLWVFGLCGAAEGGFVFVGGILQQKLGTRLATLIGCFVMSLGVFLSAFTVKVSFPLFMFTYGVMNGAGMGMAYAPPLALAMQWFVKYQGVASGCLMAGIGVGGFIFNQIQTAFLNPLDVRPIGVSELNSTEDFNSEKYFIDETVLTKVPSMFMMLGGCYFAIQLIGIALLFPVESDNSNEDQELLVKDNPANHVSESSELDEAEHESSKNNIKVMQMLRTRSFITLWFMFFLLNVIITFISSLYKTYGESEVINDDQYLTVLGATAALCNAAGRPLWGLFADKVSFKIAVTTLCAAMTCLMGTLYLSHVFADTAGKYLLFIWICCIFLTFSGSYSIFPVSIAKTFGPENVSINYGLLFTAVAVAGLIGAFLSSILLEKIYYYGIFVLSACLSAIGFVLALTFNGKGSDGKIV